MLNLTGQKFLIGNQILGVPLNRPLATFTIKNECEDCSEVTVLGTTLPITRNRIRYVFSGLPEPRETALVTRDMFMAMIYAGLDVSHLYYPTVKGYKICSDGQAVEQLVGLNTFDPYFNTFESQHSQGTVL